MKMRFDELFEMRKLTGTKLKDYIRSNGFSKVSFCKKTEISRPTLDKILNGEIDSKSTFDKHLNAWRKWLQSSYDMFLENLNKRCYTKIIIIFWRFYYAQNER